LIFPCAYRLKEPRLEFQDSEKNHYQESHLSKTQTDQASDSGEKMDQEKLALSPETAEKEQRNCLPDDLPPTNKDDDNSTTGQPEIVPYESIQIAMKGANKTFQLSAANVNAADDSSCDSGKASMGPKAKVEPLQTLPDMLGNRLYLYDTADAPTKSSSIKSSSQDPSKSEEKDKTADQGMYASIETALDAPKKGKKKRSKTLVVKKEKDKKPDDTPFGASDAIYTAVLTRGKSLIARPVPQESGSEVQDPQSLSSRNKESDTTKEKEEDDRLSPPPPVPPETNAKYASPDTTPHITASSQAMPDMGDHTHKTQTLEPTPTGELTGTSNDQSNRKEEKVKIEEARNAAGNDKEDDFRPATPPPALPLETNAKYTLLEGEEPENLYAECIPTSKPSGTAPPEPIKMNDIVGAKKSAKKLRSKTATKTITPLRKKMSTSISSLQSPLHTITPPLGSFPHDQIPEGDDHIPERWNTLRPKSSKKSAKEDVRIDSPSGSSVKVDLSTSHAHAQSMTNLVEINGGEASKSKSKKGKSLKLKALLVKKPITKLENSPSSNKDKSKSGFADQSGNITIDTAQVPNETHALELIYDEVNTNVRSAIPRKMAPPTHAAPKPICPVDFPTVFELESKAARKTSYSYEESQYEVMTLNHLGRRKPGNELAGTPADDIGLTRRPGEREAAKEEEVMYEVMTNPSKALPRPKVTETEEQLYETMISSKAARQPSAPTMDQEYEVMASIRSIHKK